jgi:hypothetical protein
MSNEHPKMLYRKGSEMHHEGHDLDTVVVEDAKEDKAARKSGYRDLADAVGAVAAEATEETAPEADEAPEAESVE